MKKPLRRLRKNRLKISRRDLAPLEAKAAVPTPVWEVQQATASDDVHSLERARTQWQFGDWASLTAISNYTLQHHPDRAKLALLAAAGHQALGNSMEARQYTRLAIDWGCSKKLVSQILIAGVHNTLGRAAAASGQEDRALKHFQASIETGSPGGDVQLNLKARTGYQLAQLGLPGQTAGLTGQHLTSQSIAPSESILHAPLLGQTLQNIAEDIKKQNEKLAAQVKQQQADLISVRKYLDSSLKKEISNSTKQMEAFFGVQNYLNGGSLVGNMHGWPISPDFALYLIELLETNDYDLILEFGSGTSTVLIAKALAKNASRRQGKTATEQVAFEHLEQYYADTMAHLQRASMAHAVQLVHAPLQPYVAPNGNTYLYYSCHGTLAGLARRYPRSSLRILVLVDGPPAATGKHARYPAVPAVLAHFSDAQIDFLLDDFIREDEKEIAVLWQTEIATTNWPHSVTQRKLEKDAFLISIDIKKYPTYTHDKNNES